MEPPTNLFFIKVVENVSIVGQSQGPGLFGYGQHNRIGLLRQTQSGTVPGSETSADIRLVGQGQKASGRHQFTALHDSSTVVKRTVMPEYGQDER
jgi:hypothetical protein